MAGSTLARQPSTSPDHLLSAEQAAELLARAFLMSFSSERTRAAYEHDLRDWFGWCAVHDLAVLGARRPHVELYARHLEQDRGLSPATVARRLSTLSGYYRYIVMEGGLDRSPLEHVGRPRVANESPTLGLELAEASAILDAAAGAGPRDEALVCLLLFNGLRVTEACSITIGDLDTVRGHRTLTVRAKGGRRRQHALAPRTAAAIDACVVGRSEGTILLANDGAPLDRFDATRIVRRLARRAGITKRISPHSLRHTAATLALDAGVSLRDVQDLMGHADPRTTRRYDRARNALERHATYRLSSYIGGACA
jgi:integrase/recombinase XerD